MPASFLSAAERERLNGFPDEIGDLDLATHFTLTAEDRALIDQRRRPANRLGFALQLCSLRHLGFVPDDLRRAPHAALVTLAPQLEVAVSAIDEYAEREQTRTDHLQEGMAALRFRAAGDQDLEQLEAWLVERALEHDDLHSSSSWPATGCAGSGWCGRASPCWSGWWRPLASAPRTRAGVGSGT